MSKKSSDSDISMLVSQARSGDINSMAELFKASYKRLYYYSFMITGNSDNAQDLLQEGFIKCMSSIDTLRNPNDFYAWMWKILRNTHLNMIRTDHYSVIKTEDEYLFDALIAEEDSPEDHAERNELYKILRIIIENLPSEQREAIILRYYDDLSVADIALIQECSASTVKSRLLYAKKAIRSAITAEERRSGTVLHGTAVIPVFPRIFEQLYSLVGIRPDTAIAVFAAAAASFGFTAASDSVKLLGTVEDEKHPLSGKSCIIRIKIFPAAVSVMCLTVGVSVLLGSIILNRNHDNSDTDTDSIYSMSETSESLSIEDTANETEPETSADSDNGFDLTSEAVSPETSDDYDFITEHTYCENFFIDMSNNTERILEVGQSFPLLQFCQPETATDQSIVIVSRDESIAVADTKEIIAVSPGNVRIYVYPANNPDVHASFLLTVVPKSEEPPEPERLEFINTAKYLLPGYISSLNWETFPSIVKAGSYKFVIDDPSIASFDGKNLYINKPGKTTIRALRTSDNKEIGSVEINAARRSEDLPEAPEVLPNKVRFLNYDDICSMNIGDIREMEYIVEPILSEPGDWYWSYSNDGVVVFDGKNITAVGMGTTYIDFYRKYDGRQIGFVLINVTE